MVPVLRAIDWGSRGCTDVGCRPRVVIRHLWSLLLKTMSVDMAASKGKDNMLVDAWVSWDDARMHQSNMRWQL